MEEKNVTNVNVHDQEPKEPRPENGGALGAIIGVTLIIIILALIGLYLWGQSVEPQPDDMQRIELEIQGTSDEVEDIERDLEQTSFEDLDAELYGEMEAEFAGSGN